jgi:carbonic anhydrase
MKKTLSLALSLALLYSCSKDNNEVVQQPKLSTSSKLLSTKAELALLEFDLSHSSRRSNFPNLGNLSGQTPIDIPKETKKFESKDPAIHYEQFSLNDNNIINNHGDYLKIHVTGENYITIRGKRYDLDQFHFHRDSEHALRGDKSAMEVHFVHVSEDGKIAVMGVFIQATRRENEKLAVLFENSPITAGTNSIPRRFNAYDLLPKTSGKYYSYNGSLTTPNLDLTPNPDGLSWIVFDSPIHISSEQLSEYAEIYEEKNARVLQPLGGRPVWVNPEYRLR